MEHITPVISMASSSVTEVIPVSAMEMMNNNFINASLNSLVMILVTEIGDKTFFIAAVLAMRNGRLVVYSGAMAALGIMHLLSSMMGFALPSLLPREYTHFLSALLFAYFGLRLLKDAYDMDGGDGPSDELQEVEEELVKKKEGEGNEEDDPESGKMGRNNREPKKKDLGFFVGENLKVFTQAFTLTFLAEWGDRSQIATIALAASKDVFGVILGGIIGHAFCTGLAVIGGRMLAAKISERTVAVVGGVLFMFFAVTSFAFGPE